MKFGFGSRNGRALRQRDPDLVRALKELEELKAETADIPPAPPDPSLTAQQARREIDDVMVEASRQIAQNGP